MPIGRKAERLYPGGSLRSPEWRAIRTAIRDIRAVGRCECVGECGHDHTGDPASLWWPAHIPTAHGRCPALNHDPHPVTGSNVVLTIAHLDHDPSHNDPGNLRAYCQRCHNAYDAPHRRAHAARTRRRRRACGDLFRGACGAGGAP